jgi:8-oxo-dGTP pyrophosphatase MutT (NUDIX family)
VSAAPAVPRPAATVMVVRQREAHLEVFMVRRHQASSFAPDQYVFPGGTIRADDQVTPDQAAALGLDSSGLQHLLLRHNDPFGEQQDGGLSLWMASLRELFEEAGILLAETSDGSLIDLAEPSRATRFEQARDEIQSGQLPLAALAQAEGLQLAAERLHYFSRWITPAAFPRRFDTRFFVAEVPAGQRATHCQIETVEGLWIEPRAALDRNDGQEYPMMFVTQQHVRRLAEFERSASLIEFTRTKPIRPISPVVDRRNEPFLTPEERAWW